VVFGDLENAQANRERQPPRSKESPQVIQRKLLLGWALAFALTAVGKAELVLSVKGADMFPGNQRYLDVTVEGHGDTLKAFGFEFRISTTAPTYLQFVDPQPYNYLSDSNYVFATNSADALYPPVGNVVDTVYPKDTFIGGDMTADGGYVTLDGTKLLARLLVTGDTILPPVLGDVFTVKLLTPTESGSTFFMDKDGNEVTPSSSSQYEGTVTINPEPSSLVAVISGGIALGCVRWFRARRRGRTS
jgi:hypothetical protein